MEKLLVICDSEKSYGKRLYEYMLRRQQPGYIVKLFTSVEIMAASLKGSHIDVLMIDEVSHACFVNSACFKSVRADRIKILSVEKPGPGIIAEECIYKYQPAKELLSTIERECGFEISASYDESKKKLIQQV